MRVLFCNIAWMNYYKGNRDGEDKPQGGGSYVLLNNDAHEKYNFESVSLSEESGYPAGDYCLGFVETKSTNGETRNQLNIEKIVGCEACKKESEVEDVLVIYCALYPYAEAKETFIVGWYKNATVYRNYETFEFPSDNLEETYHQYYNAIAKKDDCVLLPNNQRRRSNLWKVPRKKKGNLYGFGQANVWFAQEQDNNEQLRNYLERICKQIERYDGENWIDEGLTLQE